MNSIRRRLTHRLGLTFVVLLSTGLTAIYFSVRTALVDAFDGSLRAQTFAISALTEQEDGNVRFDFSADFLHSYGGEHPRNYFEFWDAAGTPLQRSPSLGKADLPRFAAGPTPRPKAWNLPLPNGHAGRAIGFTFRPKPTDEASPGVPTPAVILVVATDRGELDETLHGLLATIVGSGGLLLAAVFIAVPQVLRRGLAPLDRLGEQAATITATSLAERFPSADLPAELQPICQRLNGLLARLETSFERERRFSADLAHELRTPLAELRSLAECTLKWPETRDSATDRDTLAIARQMETLVTHMLALARGEQGALTAHHENIALEPLLREAWQPFAARAEARGLRTRISLSPGTATVDPVLLRSILSNLFDNATDHSAQGGDLAVTLGFSGTAVTIRVTNAAPSLIPGDLEKIFDRFWRKEDARSGGRHTGLGLAIARTFATATGWTLSATLDHEKRLTFILSGPVAAEGQGSGSAR